MYSDSELFEEVQSVIDALEDHQPAIPPWIVSGIISEHSRITGDDSDFYLLCAHHHVRSVVRDVFRKYRLSPELDPDPQLVFPGFKRLQKRYLIERDGEQIAIPTPMLTDKEIEAKISELERMAVGCLEHANELRRYKSTRHAA